MHIFACYIFYRERKVAFLMFVKLHPRGTENTTQDFFIISKENWKKVSRFCVDLINGLFGGFWLAGCFFF